MRRPVAVLVARCVVALLAAACVLPAVAGDRVGSQVARPAAEPVVAWRAPAYPGDWTSTMAFEPLPVERIVRMEQRNAAGGARVPLQIGVARRADLETGKDPQPLRWQPLAGGGAAARLRVESADAMALRVGLRIDGLPGDAELRFAGSFDPGRVVAVVAARQAERLAQDGLYWTPATDGEAQLVEVFVPRTGDAARVSLRVEQASHLLTDSLNSFKLTKIGESGSCNVDVACRAGELGAQFVAAKNAVARMVFVVGGSSYLCTGTLLNDTVAGTQVPYFYSANHCIADQGVANTLNTFWNYEATACSSGVAATTTQRAGGAVLLFADETTDALLLRLNDAAPAGATFAGWDSGVMAAGVDVTAIHHPAGDVKKVSLGRTTELEADQIEAGWLSGTTEGGSSGSGLFIRDGSGYRLVGGLWGGYASCASTGSLSNANNRDWYSRFDRVYPSIKAYLAPEGGGNVAPVADFSFSSSGRTVTFTDASVDADGSIASRQWQFGDGSTSTQANPVRTYAADGTYSVVLTVTDNAGATHSVTRQVAVSADGGGSVLTNGVAVSGLSGGSGSSRHFTMSVPSGATDLVVSTSGGSGDADLYVRRGTAPTTSTYDCRSYSSTSTETCAFATPAAGTWHVMVHGYSSYSGVTLQATYQAPAATTPSLSVADATVAEGDSGTRNLVFTVSLSETASSQVLFDVATVPGTATAGSDYTSLSSTNLAIAAGSRTRQVVVVVHGDTVREGPEQLQLKVSNVRGATVADATATGTIIDDDVARATLDFTGDGTSDILWRHAGTGSQRIWPGARSGQQVAIAKLPAGWRPVAVDDFDGDGRADIFLRHEATGANRIWPAGQAADQVVATRVSDVRWQVVGSGDFDGDGEADLLWRHAATGKNTIWRSARLATQQGVARVANLDWTVGGVGDFDGDGLSDILWLHPTERNQVWRSGNRATRIGLARAANADQAMAGIGDFDGDGRSDLLWRDMATGRNVIWPAGRAGDRVALARVSNLQWKVAAIGDYDGDGTADVLWRHAGTGANTIWRSANAGTTQAVSRVASQEWRVFGGMLR